MFGTACRKNLHPLWTKSFWDSVTARAIRFTGRLAGSVIRLLLIQFFTIIFPEVLDDTLQLRKGIGLEQRGTVAFFRTYPADSSITMQLCVLARQTLSDSFLFFKSASSCRPAGADFSKASPVSVCLAASASFSVLTPCSSSSRAAAPLAATCTLRGSRRREYYPAEKRIARQTAQKIIFSALGFRASSRLPANSSSERGYEQLLNGAQTLTD